MAGHNISLIMMMAFAIILLFISMLMSAMAASSAKKDCPKDDAAYKYSMYTAVVTGVAVFLVGAALLIYLFHRPLAGKIGRVASSASQVLQQHADALRQHAAAIDSADGN